MAFDDHFSLEPTDSPTRWICEYSPLVLTPRRTLQGGAGLAAALLATERVAGRPTIWATAQYLSFAAETAPIDLEVTIEVVGHNTTQARCVLSRNGQEVLTAHAALGSRPHGENATWVTPPEVPAADLCEPYRFFRSGRNDFGDLMELRLALGRQPDELGGEGGGNRSAWWCRVERGRHVPGIGELSFIGDLFPLSFMELYGRRYAGTSIDNTVRFGQRAETDWVLVDCRVDQVATGFGYGRAYLWSDDRQLLATATQTAVVKFVADDAPYFGPTIRRTV
jgi:acyl-CoA thioesterase